MAAVLYFSLVNALCFRCLRFLQSPNFAFQKKTHLGQSLLVFRQAMESDIRLNFEEVCYSLLRYSAKNALIQECSTPMQPMEPCHLQVCKFDSRGGMSIYTSTTQPLNFQAPRGWIGPRPCQPADQPGTTHPDHGANSLDTTALVPSLHFLSNDSSILFSQLSCYIGHPGQWLAKSTAGVGIASHPSSQFCPLHLARQKIVPWEESQGKTPGAIYPSRCLGFSVPMPAIMWKYIMKFLFVMLAWKKIKVASSTWQLHSSLSREGSSVTPDDPGRVQGGRIRTEVLLLAHPP